MTRLDNTWFAAGEKAVLCDVCHNLVLVISPEGDHTGASTGTPLYPMLIFTLSLILQIRKLSDASIYITNPRVYERGRLDNSYSKHVELVNK